LRLAVKKSLRICLKNYCESHRFRLLILFMCCTFSHNVVIPCEEKVKFLHAIIEQPHPILHYTKVFGLIEQINTTPLYDRSKPIVRGLRNFFSIMVV
jgi:hypothetical protein